MQSLTVTNVGITNNSSVLRVHHLQPAGSIPRIFCILLHVRASEGIASLEIAYVNLTFAVLYFNPYFNAISLISLLIQATDFSKLMQ